MPILRSHLLLEHGFAHAFPERVVDDAALRAALGVGDIVQAKQVHGARAVLASEAAAQPGAEADALVARAARAAHAVGVRVADCVPVLVADPSTGDVAAIHAGWRGVVGGVLRAGIHALVDRREGARGAPALVAAIGPCIGACCFEVGPDVAAAIAAASPPASAANRERAPREPAGGAVGVGSVLRSDLGVAGKPHVDLRVAVRAQLVALGLEPRRIEDVPGCTKHEAARFHSYRRDGADSGRMLAAVVTKRFG